MRDPPVAGGLQCLGHGKPGTSSLAGIFRRDLYKCRKCGHLEGDTSLLVCDHVKPHRGDAQLFWCEANLQTLCKGCHDSEKQAEEQTSLHTRGVWN